MVEQFIPFDLQKEISELGFDDDCLAYWASYKEDLVINNIPKYSLDKNKLGLGAATWQQAFDWFRKKFGLMFQISYSGVKDYCSSLIDHKLNEHPFYNCTTYEEARLQCLKKLIELCKNN